MYIETSVVKAALEKKTSFLYEIKILAEREVGERIINKQEAEAHYRNPKEHLEKNFRRLLQGYHSRVTHTVVCDNREMPS